MHISNEAVGPWTCFDCREIVPNVQKIFDIVSCLSQEMRTLAEEMKELRSTTSEDQVRRRQLEEECADLKEKLQQQWREQQQ